MNLVEFFQNLLATGIELWVDGDKLCYEAPEDVLTPELLTQIKQYKEEIIYLLQKRSDTAKTDSLSHRQKALWFLYQLAPLSAAYNVAYAARLVSNVDIPALRQAAIALIERHPVLRTIYTAQDGEPVQTIQENQQVRFSVQEVANWSQDDLSNWLVSESDRPFDLSNGSVLRFNLLIKHTLTDASAAKEVILLMTAHHIVVDFWSLELLVSDLRVFYEAIKTGQEVALPPQNLQYFDYVQWENQMLASQQGERLWNYWRDQLAGELPILNLPTDRPRPPVQTYEGASYSFVLEEKLTHKLLELALAEGVTLYTILLAAFQVLLLRYTNQEDILIGSPMAGRTLIEFEKIVGYFTNPVVLRADLSGNPTFRELLCRVRFCVLGALEHQDYPFPLLVERLQPLRDPSHSPLYQVAFVWDRSHQSDGQASLMDSDGLIMESITPESKGAPFDLTLTIFDVTGSLNGIWKYNTDLFDAGTIERMAGHLQTLLEGIVTNPIGQISQLPLLTEPERQQLLVEWNETTVEYPFDKCIHSLFEEQAQRTPNAVAVVYENQQLTYDELNCRANQLAHYLRGLGVGPEVLVGLCVERSLEMVVGLLGILKAGGAYVPLDPEYPTARLSFMLEDATVGVLLTQQHLVQRLPQHQGQQVFLDSDWLVISQSPQDNLITGVQATNVAYVIYTSGSTGQPKGVEVVHRGVNRLLFGVDYAHLDATQRFLQMAPISFDASTFEVWGALLHGARCVLFPGNIPTSKELRHEIQKHGITTLWLTAALFNSIIDDASEGLSGIEQLMIGGEALSVAHVQKALETLPFTQIINGYGPTESTTFTCCHLIGRPLETIIQSIPIGRPIANTQVYILDSNLQLVPIGVPGELHIGGDGLARGYLNRPQLTTEKFIPNPFSADPDSRLYKTADLARYLPNGNIEYLGRIDNQVKIRGFRIELGEIEAVLSQHSSVDSVVVAARVDTPGAQRLVAYIVPQEHTAPTISELRQFLKTKLPEYMVPSAFVILEALPLTPNGKVDRRALPTPELDRELLDKFVAPRTPIEEMLAQIWASVLKVELVGIHDNFFELGGDSILSIQIIARANQVGIVLSPKQLFMNQTIAELATVAGTTGAIVAEQGLVTGTAPLTPIQHWFFEQNLPQPHHFNQSFLLSVPPEWKPELLEQVVQYLLLHHDALRLRFVLSESDWQQTHVNSADNAAFSWFDLSTLPAGEQTTAIETTAAQLQASLNLSKDLVRVAFFWLGIDKPSRLLIIIHHLVVDGVCWRILLEDLQTAYQQISHGKTLVLPPKTTSFKDWAHRLAEYAQSQVLKSELTYWLSQSRSEVSPIPVDYAGGANTVSSASTISVSLNEAETTALLQDVPSAYNTQINDVLLTALVQVLGRWTSSNCVLLNLEGHGREDIVEDVDLSRTVGWFTTIFPVFIELGVTHNPGDALKSVKEQLRAIPNKGIGYGLLRYLSRDAEIAAKLQALPQAQISFNYLGQFDQVLNTSSGIQLPTECTGLSQSLHGNRTHLLDLNGIMIGNQLQINWTYSTNVHEHATIEHLAQEFLLTLRELIAHCLAPQSGGYTPSDFPLVKLNQLELDQVLASLKLKQELGQTNWKNIEDIYPLSGLQQGMLFHNLYAPSSGVDFTQLSCILRGNLNVQAFEQAWQQVVARHSILRTAFVWEHLSEPLQVVYRQVKVTVETHDWRELSVERQQQQLEVFLHSQRQQGFQLSQVPLMRLNLIQLDKDCYQFVWSFHHILLDGWSLPLVFKDLLDFYQAFYRGENLRVQPTVSYRNYIAWLQKQDLALAEEFWRQKLFGFIAPTPLTVDKPLSNREQSHVSYSEQQIQFPVQATADVESFARQHQLTVNTLVQATWALLLSRYSGETDVVFGATVSGRLPSLVGIESMVGLLINTLPVRVQVSRETQLLPWLKNLQALAFECEQYSYSPLFEIQGLSEVPKGTSLFGSIVVFENYPVDAALQQRNGSLSMDSIRGIEQTNYPLTVVVFPGEQLFVKISYDTNRFDDATIIRMLGHFQTLLAGIVANPQQPILQLPLLTEPEQRQLLVEWNSTQVEYPQDKCIHQLFEAQVERTPDAVAVVFEDEILTYHELNTKANQLAHYLRSLGVKPEVLVGLCLERSLEQVVGLLGILKAGGAYLPLDPAYPQDRLAFMLEDAKVSVLLTQQYLLERLPKHKTKVISLNSDTEKIAQQSKENPKSGATPGNLAYVLYSSRRGILVEHCAVGHRLDWLQQTFALSFTDAVLHKAPLAQDTAVWEIFWPLVNGGRLIIAAANSQDDPIYLQHLIARHKVSIVGFVPSALSSFIESGGEGLVTRLNSLRLVLCSGEPMHQSVALAFRAHFTAKLYNFYSLPESAGEVSYFACEKLGTQQTVPIGYPTYRPIYVLDQYLQPVPIGVKGEIYVGGTGLARGYLQGDFETSQRFVKNPFQQTPDARLFKTGELGRRQNDATLELLGSSIRQTWIKAYRVELQEVEAALLAAPSVEDARVLVRETEIEDPQLVAYVVLKGAFFPEQLQSHLQALLPAYMLPCAYVPLSTLPLLATGQVDEQALARLEVIDLDLVQKWEEQLQKQPSIEQVAVVVTEHSLSLPPLHKSDLLPNCQAAVERSSLAATRAQVGEAFKEKSGSNKPAISHGEPLRLPADAPTTLASALVRAAKHSPTKGIVYIQSDGSEIGQSYGDLLEGAQRILAGLRKLGLKPLDKVIFQLEQNQDFIPAFWGCVLGGFVPVPIAIAPTYSQDNSTTRKLENAWLMLGRPLVLTSATQAEAIHSWSKGLKKQNFQLATVDDLRSTEPDRNWHISQPEDLAILLLTSGSTGIPKAVMQSHRALLSRSAATAQANNFTSLDISLNWFGLDHVGGLVMFHIRDVYLGCQQIHAPTQLVLQDPLLWLDWIERYRATITWAPNFAYGLINDQAQEVSLRGWDLSQMRFILNGGEAIVAKHARKFLQLLAPHKLSPTAMHPSWGMSETCSGVVFSNFSLDSTTDEQKFVEVGAPIPGVKVRIVDDLGQVVSEETIGRVQINGAVVTSGYYQNPELNQEVFTSDGWFNTGDLGFLHSGRLTITGRQKDIIIINGLNYYSHEIESAVEELSGVEVSYTAAVAVRGVFDHTDKLAIFFSPAIADEAEVVNLTKEIRSQVVQKIGVNPDYLVPVEKSAIPKTAIGKIQRQQLRKSFEAGEFNDILKQLDINTGNANTLPDWFYRKIWRPKQAATYTNQLHTGSYLVFLDRLGLGKFICRELHRRNQPYVTVEAGLQFFKLNRDSYCINPNEPDHYEHLLESLKADDFLIAQILHLWTYDDYTGEVSSLEALEDAQQQGIYSLLFLIQALAKIQGSEHSVQLQVISSYAQFTSPGDKIAYEKSTLIGFLKTIPLELSWLQCRHIDLEIQSVEVNAEHIQRELCVAGSDSEIAYRNGRRLSSSLAKVDMLQQQTQDIPLKQGGIYLVSGGLGGIGTYLCQFLIKEYGAKLITVGRTELPDRTEWSKHLDEETRLSKRIKSYLSIEAAGGEFIYKAVDICDIDGLLDVVAHAESVWNEPLSGIIHLAGEGNLEYHWKVMDKHWVTVETQKTFDSMLRPKVHGTWTLYQLIKNNPQALFISFSSVNSVFGGATFSAYSAANSFLDCCSVYQRYHLHQQTYCFNWALWDDLGMSQGNPEYARDAALGMGYHIISKEQGLSSLLAALYRNQAHLIVGLDGSNRNIQRYTDSKSYAIHKLTAYFTASNNDSSKASFTELMVRDRFGTKSTCDFVQLQQMPLTDTGEIDREQLLTLDSQGRSGASKWVAPRTEIERQLASIWQQLLSVPQIGIHDNFFELGGHSLLATQLILRVQDVFQFELPLRSLFENPTVAQLSSVIVQRLIEQPDDDILAQLEELDDDQVKAMLKAENT